MQRIAERMEAAMQRGQDPVLLHFGDLDPTGVQVPTSMRNNVLDIHGLDVEVVVGGLTPEQCAEHDLPQWIDAAKSDDPNYSRWLAKYGSQAPTELDAMHPRILQETVRRELLALYDNKLMRMQAEQEQADRQRLKAMRAEVFDFLHCEYPEFGAVIEEAEWQRGGCSMRS